MMFNDKLFFVSAQVVPSFFAYQKLARAGSTALINPVGGAICTAIASCALAKLGEYLGSSYISLDSIKEQHKIYVIPSIWVISSFLTTITQFPIRFITAISPVINPVGVVTLVGLIALGALYIMNRTKPSSNIMYQQTNTPIPTSIDPSVVVTTANRVLGDIAELNKTRGLTKFSYIPSKRLDRQLSHSIEVNDRTKSDREAAIAALHQKIAKHIEGMDVIISPAEHQNCGVRTFGDPTRTFYTFGQNLLNAKTKQVIAKTTFDINQTDKSTFPWLSSKVNGRIESEIVMEPFQVVA